MNGVSRHRSTGRCWGMFSAILLVLFLSHSPLLFGGSAFAAQATLGWDPSTDSATVGYKLYYGNQSSQYSAWTDVGNQTSFTLTNLQAGQKYYFAVTAYNSSGKESRYSNEVSYTACTYSISPSGQAFGSAGGTGSLTVSTQSGCGWTAASGASWITITSGGNGTASGTVNYSVSANTGPSRTGASTIAGQTFTVTQSGKYLITATSGAGGSISPSGSISVSAGASQQFTITANSGYKVSNVTVDGASAGAVTSYTFTNVSANHTISASFTSTATSNYTLTVTKSGTGTGTVSTNPAGTSFAAGTSVSLTAAAGANSTFSGWSGACSGTLPTCSLTVNGNVTVGAAFTAQQVVSYSITASTGSGGSISPSGSVSVNAGTNKTFTITPASGYVVRYLVVDGRLLSPMSSYTFYNVQSNHTLRVRFRRR